MKLHKRGFASFGNQKRALSRVKTFAVLRKKVEAWGALPLGISVGFGGTAHGLACRGAERHQGQRTVWDGAHTDMTEVSVPLAIRQGWSRSQLSLCYLQSLRVLLPPDFNGTMPLHTPIRAGGEFSPPAVGVHGPSSASNGSWVRFPWCLSALTCSTQLKLRTKIQAKCPWLSANKSFSEHRLKLAWPQHSVLSADVLRGLTSSCCNRCK